MSKHTIHRAETRGFADHGWLVAKHTFSFASYYDPERVHFGALRVLNDDVVRHGYGFGKHPHNDMEIITIPLIGAIEHADSMGNKGEVSAGEIQVMSAGTGVIHSEHNRSHTTDLNLLQIWVIPDKIGVTPRYDQRTLNMEAAQNHFLQIVSPNPEDDNVWIHQNAWFLRTNLSPNTELNYTLHAPKTNGVYVFVIEGETVVDGIALHRRDGMGIEDVENISFRAKTDAQILVMEVPISIDN